MCKLSIKFLNNEVKYEAWIAYFELLVKYKAANVLARGDFQLVINDQWKHNYKCEILNLFRLLSKFDEVVLEYIPRQENIQANELAQNVLMDIKS